MADELARDVIGDWNRNRGDWGTFLTHCQQVALYLYPDRADFTSERPPGAKRMQYVYDAQPLFAHEMGAVGLHWMFTSDSMPWFYTGPSDPRLEQDDQAMAWYRAADQADYRTIADPSGNFASQSQEVYRDCLAFGPAIMSVLPSTRDYYSSTVFSTRHIKECMWFENQDDRVDQLHRRWQWTVKQAWDEWGAAAGATVTKLFGDGKYGDKLWFHHRVKPRRSRDAQRADARNKPFESVYVAESDVCVIEEGGFDTFPYLVPRASRITGEPQGRGRGQMMLPDIKMCNEAMQEYIRAAQLANRPPLDAPDDGYLIPLKQNPGSVNYHRSGLRPDDRLTAMQFGTQPQQMLQVLQMLHGSIEKGFFNNLLMTPTDPSDPASAGKGVTATFTDKMNREQMRSLSALNSRFKSEWQAPLVERVRYVNFRRSQALRFGPGAPYPPPPPQLAGQRWHCRFVSTAELAQRAAELTAIDQLATRFVQIKTAAPDAILPMDWEAAFRLEARDLNAPREVIIPPQVMAAMRAAQERMAQQQHEAQIASQGAGAVADLAQARQTNQASNQQQQQRAA
jgi:hypothetical protein